MIKKRFQKIVFGVVFVSMQVPVFAAADTGGFITRTIWFSPEKFFAGDTVRIYVGVFNGSERKLLGTVEFFDGKDKIGSSDFVLERGGQAGSVWVNWKAPKGDHTIRARFTRTRFEDSRGEVPVALQDETAEYNLGFIDDDTDHDTVGDRDDDDDDNDGVSDSAEKEFGSSPNTSDTDGDGYSDKEEYEAWKANTGGTEKFITRVSESIKKQKEALAPEQAKAKLTRSYEDLKEKLFTPKPAGVSYPRQFASVFSVAGGLLWSILSLAAEKFLALVVFLLDNPVLGIIFLIIIFILAVRWRRRRRKR